MRPDDARMFAQGLRDIYADAEARILTTLADRVGRGLDRPDWLDTRLAAQRALLRDVDRLLADLDDQVPGAVQRAVDLAYNRGVATAAAEAGAAGVPGELFGSIRQTGAEAVIARAAIDPLGGMRYQIRRAIPDIFDKVTQAAAAEVLTGTSTRRDASARMLARLTKDGIKGFVDRSGREWEMGAYAEMATRSATMNAALQGHTDRLVSYGVDTIMVSDAPEECRVCRPWEGRVLSLSGSTSGRLSDGVTIAGTLAEARSAGLYHPGCRHSHSIYIPGVTKRQTRTADPQGDELRQAQRAKERAIRRTKRQVIAQEGVAGKQSAGAVAARSQLRRQQVEFQAWREEHDRKNLSYRTNIKTR